MYPLVGREHFSRLVYHLYSAPTRHNAVCLHQRNTPLHPGTMGISLMQTNRVPKQSIVDQYRATYLTGGMSPTFNAITRQEKHAWEKIVGAGSRRM